MNSKHIMLAVVVLLPLTLFAQSEQQQFRLLDLESSLPIAQATFTYGSYQGISAKDGTILFVYQEDASMELSHINYGSWLLDADQLRVAIKEGVFYRQSPAINLYPVTVIAVKSQDAIPKGQVEIGQQDRLEHDAANILNQMPAFNSIRKGGRYGFDPVFRGFKYDQLNVVVNGAQSATAACPNRMDPPTSQIAPNMMDRVEILKGPHALRYGAGFGATINFIPTKLVFSEEISLYGRISSTYESNGNLLRGEGQLGFASQWYDIGFFGSWSQGDDYSTGGGEMVPSDFSRGSVGTNMGFRLSANQQLRLSGTYNRARDADFPALPMDLREDDTWMFNLRHDIQFNQDILQSWNTTVFGSFVDHLMDNLLKPLDPRMLNASTSAITYNYGGRTESVLNVKGNRLFLGADLRVEGADGIRTREFLMGPMAGNTVEDNAWQDGRISKTGFFTEYQVYGGMFDYVLSARMELNSAEINDPTNEFTAINPDSRVTQLNPSASLGVLRDLSSNLQSGFWLARAQRSGGLTERFINYFPVGLDPFEMLGNPQLDPEVNYQADLTFDWNPSKRAAIHLDLFGSYMQDYISSLIDPNLTARLPMSPGVRQFINIDNAFKTGFEANWNQILFSGLAHNLSIAYTYAQDLQRDQPLPEIAPLDIRYALSGSYVNDRLVPEMTLRYVAEQSRISDEFGETVTPSFFLLDAKIGFDITSDLSINIGLNNLLDENYFEHLNRSVRGNNAPIFAPGRNLFVNANFTF